MLCQLILRTVQAKQSKWAHFFYYACYSDYVNKEVGHLHPFKYHRWSSSTRFYKPPKDCKDIWYHPTTLWEFRYWSIQKPRSFVWFPWGGFRGYKRGRVYFRGEACRAWTTNQERFWVGIHVCKRWPWESAFDDVANRCSCRRSPQ